MFASKMESLAFLFQLPIFLTMNTEVYQVASENTINITTVNMVCSPPAMPTSVQLTVMLGVVLSEWMHTDLNVFKKWE